MTIFMSLALLLSSCSDALDVAPSGDISLEEVFSDNDRTMYYLNTCYSSLPNKGLHYFFWSRGPVNWCDDSWDADDLDVDWAASRRLYDGNASASSHPVWNTAQPDQEPLSRNYWQMYFSRIRNCGIFLQNIEKANVKSEDDRSRWTAEAHLLRAYYYMELLQWFGCGLPIIEESLTYTSDFSQTKRSSYYEVVQFIVKECDVALSCDQLPWRITSGSEEMRVTKALAWAIKSRMTLFAASPLYAGNENHWEEAYQTSKQALAALTANDYKLYDKVSRTSEWGPNAEHLHMPGYTTSGEAQDYNAYAALYNEYFCNSGEYSQSPADKETIFQLINNNGDVANVDGIGAICGYKTGTCPSQDLVDAYETVNGQTVLNLEKPYNDDMHLQPNYNSANAMYDPQNPYANRDPRFYASIYYNGSKRYCEWTIEDKEEVISFENYPGKKGRRTRIVATWDAYQKDDGTIENTPEPKTGRSMTGRTYTRTGYYERKFLHPNSGMNNRLGGARHKDFRLAEIYLNLAEAAANAGHEDEARTAMNVVRARVGMPAVPASVTGNALILRIHNERRVEFALEGNRYFDVRRWQSPEGDLSATDRWITGAHITHMKDGSYKYERTTLKERNCWSNKWLKVAIPLTEVNNMISITGENWQNPGW